jgi:hypothetical protein
MIYLQGQNVLANVTFAAVRDAIMAEFERTSRPSSLAVQKISTRTNQSSAPKASGDAPQGAPNKKKKARWQKGQGAHNSPNPRICSSMSTGITPCRGPCSFSHSSL